MDSKKPLTPIQRMMQLRGVSMRELAGLSGESTALVCYIARGLAHFPTYAQLERCARYMGCRPEDLYTKAQLRMMYPEQFPRRKRENRTCTVHVRIDPQLAGRLREYYPDRSLVHAVNDMVDFMIRHTEVLHEHDTARP